MGHVAITMPFHDQFDIGGLGLAAIKQCTKFEISTFTHYKDITRIPSGIWSHLYGLLTQ